MHSRYGNIGCNSVEHLGFSGLNRTEALEKFPERRPTNKFDLSQYILNAFVNYKKNSDHIAKKVLVFNILGVEKYF